MGSDGGRVYLPQVKVNQALLIKLQHEPLQDAIQKATYAVISESVVDRTPTSVAFGQISPGGPTAQHPKHAVHH